MEPNLERLGKRIAEARRKVGLNQAATARRVGISAGQLNAIEAGKSATSVPTLRMIAEVVGVKRSELLLLAGKDEHAAWDQLREGKAEVAAAPGLDPQNLVEILRRAAELAAEQAAGGQDEPPVPSPPRVARSPRPLASGPKRKPRMGTQGNA